MKKIIGILGGTFDPVHNAHLQMAMEAKQTLGLDEVRLVPCHRPPHRETPTVSSQQRLHLLSLAVSTCDGLEVDDRELYRDKASYTVDTLLSLRDELGEQVSLVFMLGTDAFAHLKTWHQWSRLRELAHLVIIARPDNTEVSDVELKQWISEADDIDIIGQQAAGGLIMLKQSLLAVSATDIRQQLSNGEEVGDLPLLVANYIKEQGLYKKAF